MELNLHQIKEASKCLRYYNQLQSCKIPESNKNSDTFEVINKIIMKSYRIAMETGWKVEWKKILGWVDSTFYLNADLTNEEEIAKIKRETEKILILLKVWHNDYVKEQKVPYINIPIEKFIGNTLISENIPIILIGNSKPTIVLLGEIDLSVRKLYNNIEIRGLQWLVANLLETDSIEVKYYSFEGTVTTIVKMFAGVKEHKRTEQAIKNITSLIELGIDYPSVTDMCKTCRFRVNCKL